jgi:hypothetical protein
MTMIGASLLWVGWFGFNAGSNLEANGVTAVAFINTLVATCCGGGRLGADRAGPSRQGLAAGCGHWRCRRSRRHHPGLRLRAPMTSILLGFAVSPICYFFVTKVKSKFGYDDSLDVFGVHCIGGIVGAIAPAIVADPALGGQGFFDYTQFPAGVGAYDMAAGHHPDQGGCPYSGVVRRGFGDALLHHRQDHRSASECGRRAAGSRPHQPRRARLQHVRIGQVAHGYGATTFRCSSCEHKLEPVHMYRLYFFIRR